MAETSLTLLERLQTRPESASWRKFMDLYAPLIGRWLSRTPLQKADHEDLVQEVLKIVVRKLPEFERRREGSFRAWLRVVSVNCLREFWRASKQRPQATGGARGDLPTYFGAFPPGSAQKDGDWFTRLRERAAGED